AEAGMRFDAAYTLPDEYLQKVDVASMAFSLEARDPLLDQDLVEWAMRLPLRWKLRGRENKYLLRRLAYRYVPRRLLDRPKRGFAVPIDRWLRGPLAGWARDLMNDPTLFSDLPLDRAQALVLLDLHLSGRRNVHPLLWAVLMLLAFWRRHQRGTH
ncbi:MAG: asparagine synthetase B, partial [Betaproteobacteria bacterium]